MCARPTVDLDSCTGSFDLEKVLLCNLHSLGRNVVNSFENTYNFCCELGLINRERKCNKCRRPLKVELETRARHTTPVHLRCTAKNCKKSNYSIRSGSVFDQSPASVGRIPVPSQDPGPASVVADVLAPLRGNLSAEPLAQVRFV